MGRQIDERVVQMKFENGQFERGVQTSIKTVQQLKKGLDFEDSIKGFEKLDKASQNMKLDALISAVDKINNRFTLLGITGVRVMERIADSAINTGKALVKSLSTDQISVGWDKFASKTSSVQTIMAATASKFSDTGEQMRVVNEQLDKLNWFTDETSYNFVDMVNNIGKFTSNNIDLDKSVTAMQGIANWAAISGANANEASRAMYNISQALSTGSVKLIDWKSIENANMATAEFKKTVIETAAAEGTLIKTSENTFKTLDGKVEISTETFNGFNDSLQKGWFSTEVLMTALDRYGGATNKLNEIYEKHGILTSEIVSGIDAYTEGTKTAEEVSKDWGISLEETQGYLNEFSTETMQFGLKAFKAAQEAKTFQDAIDSVKDAVSTGWMKSFELIFGDYMQAKEFWTEIANTLYGIFAESGNARNDMLKEWNENNGRNYFIDSIYASFAMLLSIMNPLKAAWQSVFTPMDADRLVNITKALRDLILRLTLTEETQVKLARTARGLISVLDILKTFAFGGVSKVFKLISALSGQSSLDILEFTARIGDFLYAVRNWIKQQTFLNDAIDKSIEYIALFVGNIKNFVWWFKDLPAVQAASTSAMELFNAAISDSGNFFRLAGYKISAFITKLKESKTEIKSFADIKRIFKQFFNEVILGLSDIQITLPNVSKAFTKFKNSVGDALQSFIDSVPGLRFTVDVISKVFAGLFSILESFIDVINNLVSQINYVDVVSALLAFGLYKSLTTIAKAINEVTNIFKSVRDIVRSVTDTIKVFGDAWSKYMKSKAIMNYAISIAILVGALAVLTMLDYDKLLVGVGVLGALAAGMVAFAAAMAIIDKKIGGTGASPLIQIGLAILALAAAILLLAKALDMLQMNSPSGGSLATLAILMAGLGAFSVAMKKFSGDIKDGAKTILAFAAGIILLTYAVKSLGKMDTQVLGNGLVALTGILLVFGLAVRLMSKSTKTFVGGDNNKVSSSVSGAASQILAFAVSVHILIAAFRAINKLDTNAIIKGIGVIGVIFLEFAALSVIISRFGKGNTFGNAGMMVLTMSIALNLIVPALRSIAKLSDEEIDRATNNLSKIGLVFVAAIALSKFAGKNAHKAGVMLLEMVAAMAILPIVIKAFGSIDDKVLKKGLTAFTVIGTVFSVAIIASEKSEKAKSSIIAMAATIAVLGIVVYEIGKLDPANAIASSAALSMLLLSISVSFKILSKVESVDKKAIGNIFALAGLITALGFVITCLAKFSTSIGADPNMMLSMVASVSLLLVALTGVYAAIGGLSKIKAAPTKAMMEKFTTIAVIAGALGMVISIMSVVKNTRSALQMTQILSLFMLELVGLFAIFSASMGHVTLKKEAVRQFTSFSAVIAVAGVIITAMSHMANPSGAIQAASALAILLPMIATSMAILAKTNVKFDKDILAQFLAFEALVGVLGLILTGLTWLIQQGDVDLGKMQQFAIVMDTILPILALVTSGLAVVASKVKVDIGGISALAVSMDIVFVAVGAIVVGFAALCDNFEWARNALEVAPYYFGLLGQALGSIVAAFIDTIGSSIIGLLPKLGTALGDFINNLGDGFFKTLKKIDDDVVHGATNFALVMTALAGGELVNAISTLVSGVFNKISEALGIDTDLETKFENIGAAIAAFAKKTKGINAEKVRAAADSASILSALESNLPGSGGALQYWIGEKDIGSFGDRLEEFGEGLKRFANETKDISPEQVTGAAEAAKLLVSLEQGVPRQGGELERFLGKKDLEDFGYRLATFGLSLKNFATNVDGITENSVSGAAAAAEMLINLEHNIVPADGALQAFFGHQSYGYFGARLDSLGQHLVNYINDTKSITKADVEGSAAAIGVLAELEKELDTTGGVGAIFFGDSSFENFAKNLKALGEALDDYDQEIDNVDVENINKVSNALVHLINMASQVSNLGNWSDQLKTAIWNWIDAINQDISAKEETIKSWGSNIITWLANGISQGLDAKLTWIKGYAARVGNAINDSFKENLKINASYSQVMKENGEYIIAGLVAALNDTKQITSVQTASANLAKAVDQSFKAQAEIHSPSAVMQENGVWLVKGITEGIKSDMSAEEAMAKKAQNIASAFKTAIENSDIYKERDQLVFKLWEANEGRNASDSEKTAKNIEAMVNELGYMATEVQSYRGALAATAKEFGEGSKQYIEAENTMNQALLKMYEQRNKIEEAQASLVGNASSSREKADAYRELMSSDWVKDYQRMMEWSNEELVQWAKEQTGFGIDQKTTGYDLESIMAPAFSEQQVKIVQESVSNAVTKSVGQGLTDGVKKSDPEGTAQAIVTGFEKGATDEFEWKGLALKAAQESGLIPDAIAKKLDINSPSKVMIPIGQAIPEGLGVGMTQGVPYLQNSSQAVAQQLISSMNASIPQFQTLGEQAMNGFTRGIQSAGQAAVSAARSIANSVTSMLATALSIHSPSRVTAKIGEYVSLGLAKGITDNAGAVTNASEDLANNTITMLDYAKSAIDDVLSTDDDFEPTITPVLNMDDLKKQARNIPSVLNSQNGISTLLANISAQEVARRRASSETPATDEKVVENVTNVNYTQNNYSPKALNRRDIYRQTNNQIAQLKGAIKR